MGWASGRVTSEGTKNTGSHLASNVAPGLRDLCNRLSFDEALGIAKSAANTTPHPASDEGNLPAMPNPTNNLLKTMSSAHQRPTDRMALSSCVSDSNDDVSDDEELVSEAAVRVSLR